MSINRYGAVKQLNKANFINLLSTCNEETLKSIVEISKGDILKIISDRMTKLDLQQLVYNLDLIQTEDILAQHEIRQKKIKERHEKIDMSGNKIEYVPIPDFDDAESNKKMKIYLTAFKKAKNNVEKQNNIISVIRDNSKRELSIFLNNISNIVKNKQVPIFEEIHDILFKALSDVQQSAMRKNITEVEMIV
jgi:hypothetical protein